MQVFTRKAALAGRGHSYSAAIMTVIALPGDLLLWLWRRQASRAQANSRSTCSYGRIACSELPGACSCATVYLHQASELSEYDAYHSAGHGVVASVLCVILKGVLLATYLPGGHDEGTYDDSLLVLGLVYAFASLADIVCMWAALTKFTHRNVSNSHKFQAVGLGWALGDTVLRHVVPILMGARKPEYTLAHVIQAIEANISLVHAISFAAVGAMLWSKRSKPLSLLPLLRLSIAIHALLPAAYSLLDHAAVLPDVPQLAAYGLAASALAGSSWYLWQSLNLKQT